MRIGPLKTFVLVLKDQLPGGPSEQEDRRAAEKESAHQQLKRLTGQDFGLDGEHWERWLLAEKPDEYW